MSSGAETPSFCEGGVDRRVARLGAVQLEDVGSALDRLEELLVVRRKARIDEPLPGVDDVTSDDRVAVAVLRVSERERVGHPIRRDGRHGCRQRRHDVEVLVEIQETAAECVEHGDVRAGRRLRRVERVRVFRAQGHVKDPGGIDRARRARRGRCARRARIRRPRRRPPERSKRHLRSPPAATRLWHRRMPPR